MQISSFIRTRLMSERMGYVFIQQVLVIKLLLGEQPIDPYVEAKLGYLCGSWGIVI